MGEPQKRTVLTRHWIGDEVYHVADGAKGFVLTVSIHAQVCLPKYYVVFSDRKGEWCEEMELSTEKVFPDATGSAVT